MKIHPTTSTYAAKYKAISRLGVTYKYSINESNLIFLIDKTIFAVFVFKIPANCNDYNLPVPARSNRNHKKDASGGAASLTKTGSFCA